MSVYFVTCREANAVKIGHSGDPFARAIEIQCGCPFDVKLEATIPGGLKEEKRLHKLFGMDRLRGEWFRLNPVIEAIIAGDISIDDVPLTEAVRVLSPRERSELQERLVKEAGWRVGERRLRKHIARGHIHFPFRSLAELEGEQ